MARRRDFRSGCALFATLALASAAASCSKQQVFLATGEAEAGAGAAVNAGSGGGQPQPSAANPTGGSAGPVMRPYDAGEPQPDGARDNDAGSSTPGAMSPPTRPIASPPSYQGNRGSAACDTTLRSSGFEPADDKRHPLFLYFVGTEFVSADDSSKYNCKAAAKVTEAMARRGFVALSVEYDNLVGSILNNKLSCLYDKKRADSLIVAACNLSNVDCNLGIATWGHSQGALLAHAAAIGDTRVKAVWTTGYGGNDNPPLAYDRLRVVNAEGDTMNGSVDTLNKAAGLASADCPDARDTCLRADGSGWILVRKAQCKTTSADHCWFDKTSCGDNRETLEPNWVDPSSSQPFALEANADWVAATVARP